MSLKPRRLHANRFITGRWGNQENVLATTSKVRLARHKSCQEKRGRKSETYGIAIIAEKTGRGKGSCHREVLRSCS